MPEEFHISSVVVQTRPSDMVAVIQRLGAIPGACVHAAQNGKIVVTLETGSEHALAQHLNQMSLMDGVYTATLVFHHVETESRAEPLS